LRDVGQIERCRRIHDARIVNRKSLGNGRRRAGGENRVLELHLDVASSASRAAVRRFHAQAMRIEDFGQALHVLNLAGFDELSGSARQPLYDVVLEVPEFGEIDLRLAEFDAPCFGVA
jgi:hypothetical protein